MINLHAAQLLSLPTGAKSDVAAKLPWPNGSLVTAKVTPTDSEGSVIISLGGYRLRAQVPPNTPLGHVWLLLINREMPAQFRLLHDSKAASVLADALAQKMSKEGVTSELGQRMLQSSQDSWQKMNVEQLPFRADLSANGQYIMLRDQADDGARGMVRQKEEGNGFLLHGRVDLDYLGAVAFALHGEDLTWALRVYAKKEQSSDMLRGLLSDWLIEQEKCVREHGANVLIEGRVDDGLPENLSIISGLEA